MTKAASGKPPNFHEWASNIPPAPTRCKTCNQYPELLDDINEYVKRTKDRTLRVSLRKFHATHLRRHGYKLCLGALLNHITDCLGGMDAEKRKA